MAKKRKPGAPSTNDRGAGSGDAVSLESPPTPDTHPASEPRPETEPEGLGDLYRERTTLFRRLETKCPWCGSSMHLEDVRAGQRIACPKVGCNGGVTIGERGVRYDTDVRLLHEGIQLPGELAAAFQTERPMLAGWLDRALSAEEATAVGRSVGVLLEHNRRLGLRVEELEHHLDLLAHELRQQVGVARGLEAALSRIHRFTRLPVDPDLGLSGSPVE
jgi:hypothetical protein